MKLKADEKQQVTSQPSLNNQQTWFVMLHDLWKMKEPVTAVYFTVLIV